MDKNINKTLHSHDEKTFVRIQQELSDKIILENVFEINNLKHISGVDLAYWSNKNIDYAVCSIVTIDYKTKNIVETKSFSDMITVPYVAGFLSFRELPLILETYKLLNNKPDIVMFDGNGYLHYRNMGIATHASFFINKPTIGVAKSYLKIDNVEYIMPNNKEKSYTDIVIRNKVYGRALRTHKDGKPIFISCGNWIELETAMDIVLSLIDKTSRQPLPTRFADIETKKQRSSLVSGIKNY